MRGIGLWIVGQGLAASVVCMDVCHAFGVQLISGKDCSGFRNVCHIALENVAQKDVRTSSGDLEDVLLC